jgi:Domain of unknown function (DUF4398)
MERQMPMENSVCRGAMIVAALALLAACSRGEPPPTAQMNAAQASLDAAAKDGAAQRASQDYVGAQNKLAQAQQALNKDNTSARRLAQEADVDAQLSAAKARTNAANAALSRLQGNPPPLQ